MQSNRNYMHNLWRPNLGKFMGVVLAVAILSGCSTLHKTAEEMMEKESYDEAIKTYETLLRKNPNDTDAIAGLRSAKEKYLDKRLIEIRLARIGNNHEQSWDMLLDVVKRERIWNFYPVGSVTFSQEEETRLALDQLKLFVDRAVREKLPIKAEYAIRKYSVIFEKTFNDEFVLIDGRVSKSGREKCLELRKNTSGRSPYYSHFVQRMCEYFSQNKKFEKNGDSRLAIIDFFGTISHHTSILRNKGSVSHIWVSLAENAVSEATRASAWWHNKGKLKLNLELSSQLSEDLLHEKVDLVHEYQVQIPYEKAEPVKVRKVVTQQGTHQVKDPYTGVLTSVPVVESKEFEEVIVSRKTEFRSELRTVHFEGNKVTQRLKFEAQASALVGGAPLSAPWVTSVENQSLFHNQGLPMVKLEPKPLKLPNSDEWFQAQFVKLKDAWGEALKRQWILQFCSDGDSKRSIVERGNDAFKCVRQENNEYPSHVENWFEQYFGVSVSEFSDLFDLHND